MYKRMVLFLVADLALETKRIADKKGLSMNALISEMAMDFVHDWENIEFYTLIENQQEKVEK